MKKIINHFVILATLMASFAGLNFTPAIAVAATTTVYDALPNPLPYNAPSQPFQAQQTFEFGDYVHLGGTDRILNNITVAMTDWARYSEYSTDSRYMGNNSTWSHPITINVYGSHLDANGVPDTLLATKTQSIDIPWRPEGDVTCPDTGYGAGFAWKAADNNCYNGFAFNAVFDLSSLNTVLPDDVIVSLAYDTQTYGASPIGLNGPYNSLNVLVPANQSVTVGSDDSIDQVFWNTSTDSYYSDGGDGPNINQLRKDTNWSPYGTVAMQITATSGPSGGDGQTCSDHIYASGVNTQFTGLTTTNPGGSSDNSLFTVGAPGSAVIATPTGYPGAWDGASSDPDVSGASWVNNSTDQPNNPADGNPGGDGTVDTWRLFSNSFSIPANATSISSPVLHFTADNSVEAFLDDVSVGTSPTFTTVADSAPLSISTGDHAFKFVVKNDAFQGLNNPTGLIYKTTINYCVPNTPPPTSSTVHIFKYIDGEQATTQNADGVSFPMFTSTYNAPFILGPSGWTNGDIAYEASTSPMNIGSSYSAEETLGTSLVGTNCDGAHDYALVGYSVGNTMDEALNSPSSLTIPNFTNLQGDKYIIVHNQKCETIPPIKVHILKYLDGQKATAESANNYQFPMTATWNAFNIGAGTGNYVLGNNHGGALDQYGADTSPMSISADYTTSEITSGDSLVVASNELCAPGKYLLNGYRTSSTSFADAATQTLSTTAPAFTNLSADQYIIVDNSSCPTTGTISGMKYNDKNENGKKGNNEPGLAGWTIQLKSGNTVVATTVTDANGNYTFSNVAPGTYKVREVHQNGWKRRSKNPKAIVITAGSVVTDVNFGNSKKEKKEKEDTDKDDNRDEQSGEYHSNHDKSDYEHDQNNRNRR